MKNKKLIIIIVAAIILVGIAVIAFSGSSSSYLDTFSTTEIYDRVDDSFTTVGGTRTLDDDVILEFTDKDLPYLIDYTVVKAKNAKNINEIGIFKVQDGKAKDLKNIIQKYVEDKQQLYRSMDYFPEEVEKIDFAKVSVMGNYVVYSFLNEKDTEAFYSAIEELIKK